MAAPARKIRPSAVKNIVRFPAIKAGDGRPILLGSKFCLHLEFDPTVVSYQPQPRTFDVVGLNGLTKYTPDFEALYTTNLRVFIEVKPREKSLSEHYLRWSPKIMATIVGNVKNRVKAHNQDNPGVV